MITITLGKKEYDVPTEMSVEQYQKIQTQRLFLDNSDPSKLLAAYLDIDVKEIKNANKEQVKFLEAFVFERLTKNVSKDVIFTFDYEGVTYGFENDWKKLAWGAWQDLEFLSSENVTDNIHKILAVLYRPVTKMNGTKYKTEAYDANTIDDRAELFKKIPIKIWFGAAQLFFFIGTFFLVWLLNRSKLGYRLRAIRDQSDAASSLGIHVSKYKIIAFVISAMIMAPMGSIYAQYVLIVDPNNAFNVDISILVLLISVMGGVGNIWGPIIGAVILIPISEFSRIYFGGTGHSIDLIVYGV